MADAAVLTEDLGDVTRFAPGYAAPFTEVTGGARSSAFEPGTSLWTVGAVLEPGATLTWQAVHGDEGIYVKQGRVAVDGIEHPAGTAVVVEANARPTVTAVDEVELVHVGPTSPEPPTDGPYGPPSGGGHVHVVEPSDQRTRTFASGSPVTNQVLADSSCPSCRINFFIAVGDRGHVAPSHAHSRDEIMHLLDGELVLGGQKVRPGTSVSVPGHHRYGYRAAGPYRFLNYRADITTVVMAPGSEPRLEV